MRPRLHRSDLGQRAQVFDDLQHAGPGGADDGRDHVVGAVRVRGQVDGGRVHEVAVHGLGRAAQGDADADGDAVAGEASRVDRGDADDAGVQEALDPGARRRGGQAHAVGEFAVAGAAVVLQHGDEVVVEAVQLHGRDGGGGDELLEQGVVGADAQATDAGDVTDGGQSGVQLVGVAVAGLEDDGGGAADQRDEHRVGEIGDPLGDGAGAAVDGDHAVDQHVEAGEPGVEGGDDAETISPDQRPEPAGDEFAGDAEGAGELVDAGATVGLQGADEAAVEGVGVALGGGSVGTGRHIRRIPGNARARRQIDGTGRAVRTIRDSFEHIP